MKSLRDIAPFDVELEPGFPVRLRPIEPSDGERAQQAYARLSPESRRNRFWQNTLHLSPELAQRLVDTDDRSHIGWVALPPDDVPGLPGYGGASFWREEPDSADAEFSITVLDDWQRRGFGALLLSVVWWEAYVLGIERFTGVSLPGNERLKRWWESAGGSAPYRSGQHELALPVTNPIEYADRVAFDLHADTVAVETAMWFRQWQKRLDVSL